MTLGEGRPDSWPTSVASRLLLTPPPARPEYQQAPGGHWVPSSLERCSCFPHPLPPPIPLSTHCALPPPLPSPFSRLFPPLCACPLSLSASLCPSVLPCLCLYTHLVSLFSFFSSLPLSAPSLPTWLLMTPCSLTLHSCSVSLAHAPPLPWGSWPRWVPSYLGRCYLLLKDRQVGRLGAVGDQGPTPHFIVWQTPDPVFCGTKQQLAQQALGRESGGPRSPGPAGFLRRAALSIVSPARTAETLASSHMALPLPGPCPEAALTNTRWGWACDGVPTSCQSRERGNLRKVGWRPGFEFRLSHCAAWP